MIHCYFGSGLFLGTLYAEVSVATTEL